MQDEDSTFSKGDDEIDLEHLFHDPEHGQIPFMEHPAAVQGGTVSTSYTDGTHESDTGNGFCRSERHCTIPFGETECRACKEGEKCNVSSNCHMGLQCDLGTNKCIDPFARKLEYGTGNEDGQDDQSPRVKRFIRNLGASGRDEKSTRSKQPAWAQGYDTSGLWRL